MIETQLIIISGICGAGKSTTAQEITRQLASNSIPHNWFHEEIQGHPLKPTKIYPADAHCTHIEDYTAYHLSLWQQFVAQVKHTNSIAVLDSYLYQSTVRILLETHYPKSIIRTFYHQLLAILADLQPVLINVYKSDVETSFRKVWRLRGEYWKRIVIDLLHTQKVSEEEYRQYEQVALQWWTTYQDFIGELFEHTPLRKLRIDTSGEEWTTYHQNICQLLQIDYYPQPQSIVSDLEQYCGTYTTKVGDTTHTLFIKCEAQKLYCEAFWPYMELSPIQAGQFLIRSFPIELHFRTDKQGRIIAVDVEGSYDWEMIGKSLNKQ